MLNNVIDKTLYLMIHYNIHDYLPINFVVGLFPVVVPTSVIGSIPTGIFGPNRLIDSKTILSIECYYCNIIFLSSVCLSEPKIFQFQVQCH